MNYLLLLLRCFVPYVHVEVSPLHCKEMLLSKCVYVSFINFKLSSSFFFSFFFSPSHFNGSGDYNHSKDGYCSSIPTILCSTVLIHLIGYMQFNLLVWKAPDLWFFVHLHSYPLIGLNYLPVQIQIQTIIFMVFLPTSLYWKWWKFVSNHLGPVSYFPPPSHGSEVGAESLQDIIVLLIVYNSIFFFNCLFFIFLWVEDNQRCNYSCNLLASPLSFLWKLTRLNMSLWNKVNYGTRGVCCSFQGCRFHPWL